MSEDGSLRYCTKHRMNDIILAIASQERAIGKGTATRDKLCDFTKIPYQSIGVYLSWLKKLNLISINHPGRRGRVRQTYELTDWGNAVADGHARIFVYYDFIWLRIDGKVPKYFQYRHTLRTRDIRPEVEQYLKSGGTMPMPDMAEKPEPLPARAPIAQRTAPAMPVVVVVPPVSAPPPAPVLVPVVAGNVLNKAMTPSTVRQPTKEMLMGGCAPRRWRPDPL